MVGILIDEMHIREDLVYFKHTGQLCGFANMGDIDEQLLTYEKVLNNSYDTSPRPLAKTMMIFSQICNFPMHFSLVVMCQMTCCIDHYGSVFSDLMTWEMWLQGPFCHCGWCINKPCLVPKSQFNIIHGLQGAKQVCRWQKCIYFFWSSSSDENN